MRKIVAGGAAVAAVYIAVVVGTTHLSHHRVRPLLDGATSTQPYRWVRPPPDFRAGNVPPQANDSTITMGDGGSLQSAGASEDSQFVFAVPAGAIPAHTGDKAFIAHVAPLDPDTLGALPAKTYSDGNAYQLTFAYDPSRTAITALKQPGTLTLTLTVPVPADTVRYSPDGKTWQVLDTQHISATTVGAALPGPGYYVGTTPDVSSLASKGSGGGGVNILVPIVVIAVLAALLLVAPRLLARRRQPPARGRQAGRNRARHR